MDCLVVVDALIEGFRVRRIRLDGGSSLEVMYEHCFRNLSYRTRSRLKESRIPLVGFLGEVNYPLGVIDLEVTIGEYGKTRTVIMEFAVVKSPFPYNALLATIATTIETLRECTQIEEAQALSWHARVTDPSLMQTSSEGKKLPKSSVEEKIVNVDIFVWTPADMTGIPRAITEHSLDTYPHIEPKVQKKRSLAPDRMKVVIDEVNEWLKADGAYNPTWVCKSGASQEGRWELENVHRLIKESEQGKPKGSIPLARSNGRHTRDWWTLPSKSNRVVNLEAYVDDMVIKITSEGIRANPEKAKAVMDMPSPKTLKQMQSLMTEAAESSVPRDEEVGILVPTLTTPKKGETLMMYLACTNEAVSAVLLTKRNGRQMPIHYVSRSLQGAETNYAPMEKLALALVHAARRLRRGLWHNVRAKGSNKGPEPSNARGDPTPGPKAWRLYTDGASNNEGSGAGLILIAPDDVEYSYALRLNFSNSNNEAEYEALPRLASDSQGDACEGQPCLRRTQAIWLSVEMVEDEGPTLYEPPSETYLEEEVLPGSADEVCRFGIPATIITDNGTQFVNDPFKKQTEKLKIQLISTLVYHPQGNGAVEIENKSSGGASPKLKPAGGTERNNSYKGGQVQTTGREVLQQKGKLGPTWEEPYKVIQAFQNRAYKLSNMEGKRYLGPGMLVTFEGATCKAPEYLYFYYVSLPEKQFSKYKLAPKVTLDIIDVLFLLA
ncbi:reverse transcriptase domain-containing protein [Tanacetum coccineum]